MKTLNRKLTAVLLCLCVLASAVMPALADSDEVRAAKKIISVVYDDSGSMQGDSWVYANYAMQALTALLNEQDELYLTYMSDPYTTLSVDLANIDGAVSDIRNWSNAGGTPGEALDTARDKLDDLNETDVTTQFWLVVMTDGVIDMSQSVQTWLNNCKSDKMRNGSKLNVVYLPMGSAAVSAVADKSKGLYVFEASDASTITDAMEDVANLVSGRVSAEDVIQVDDKTVSFRSDLPMYSISVLSQQSSASVTGASSAEHSLHVDRNIVLDAADPFWLTATTLHGNAAVINRVDGAGVRQVIPAGEYTITFSEAVDVSSLVIQYEPAIGLKLVMESSGVEVTDPSALAADSKVRIELIPVVPGTDEEIDPKTLPKNIGWSIEYYIEDQLVDEGSGSSLSNVSVQPGRNTVIGTMQIPGFAPSVYKIEFDVAEIVYDFGIQVNQPEPLTYYRKTAADGSAEGSSLSFHITNEGVPLTKEEQEEIGVKLELAEVTCDNSAVEGYFNRFGKLHAGCDLVRNDDGSYSVAPRAVIPFTAFLMMAGEYTVTVCLKNDETVTAQGHFTMEPLPEDWEELGKLVLAILVLLYLIYILFIKYKFKGQTVYYEVYRQLGGGRGAESPGEAFCKTLSPLTLDLLLPRRACEVRFYGLILRAGPDGSVEITGKSIARQVSRYGSSSANPVSGLGGIAASMRSTVRKNGKNREERSASDLIVTGRPAYFKTSDTDTVIWRIRCE